CTINIDTFSSTADEINGLLFLSFLIRRFVFILTFFFYSMMLPPPRSTLFPYTTLFRSDDFPPGPVVGDQLRDELEDLDGVVTVRKPIGRPLVGQDQSGELFGLPGGVHPNGACHFQKTFAQSGWDGQACEIVY